MRGRILFIIIAAITGIVAVAFAFAHAQFQPRAKNSDPMITVMNPAVASKMAERLPLAPRLHGLEGRTVYMVDINWGGPEAALSIFEEMQKWFARNLPRTTVVIKMKKGGYEANDPALWKEIGNHKGSAAILGVSG